MNSPRQLRQNHKRYFIAALALVAATASHADPTTRQMSVTVNALGAANVIRTDITSATFGTGIAHDNPQFRGVMQTPTAAQTAIKAMKLGSMRFSNGTPGLHYIWDSPTFSYMQSGAPAALALTPAEMYSYTASSALNMEKVFEVNTYQYWNAGLVTIFKPNVFPATIEPTRLDNLATRAAAWVTNNVGQPAGNRVTYWEVGNEDWVYWTPGEYATIFNKFATKMKQSNPSIRLLAQSLTNTRAVPGKVTNDDTWVQKLVTGGIQTADVYALSEHQYLHGGDYPTDSAGMGGPNDWRIWQTEDMLAQIQASYRLKGLKQKLSSGGLNWKIWMTEFNVFQPKPAKPDEPVTLQDVGHALVVADWTGKMLELGVERMFMHSLDHHPAFALVQYQNGASVSDPKVTAPGYAYSKFAQEFGPKMVTNTINGNVTWGSHKSGPYDALSVYSSVREVDSVYGGYPALRVMVINRHWSDPINLTIKTKDRPIAGGTKNYYVQTLGIPAGGDLRSSNNSVANTVKWSTQVASASDTAGITYLVPKSSVTFFIIPLQ